jgi:hypothetical protein
MSVGQAFDVTSATLELGTQYDKLFTSTAVWPARQGKRN